MHCVECTARKLWMVYGVGLQRHLLLYSFGRGVSIALAFEWQDSGSDKYAALLGCAPSGLQKFKLGQSIVIYVPYQVLALSEQKGGGLVLVDYRPNGKIASTSSG